MNTRPSRLLTGLLLLTYFTVASTAFAFGLSHVKFDKDDEQASHSCPWFWQVKSTVGLPSLPPFVTPHWTMTSDVTPEQHVNASDVECSPSVRGPPLCFLQ